MKKICTFEHSGGNMIVSDPGVDEVGGITNLVFGIYPGDAGRRLSVYLPEDSYNFYLKDGDMSFRIIRDNAEGRILEESCEPVSTFFSRNLCCVDSKEWGSSMFLSKLPPSMVQFKPKDMLKLIKERKLRVSGKCKMALDEAVKNDTYPDASVLDESLLFLLKEIPNTSWSTFLMLMTHESPTNFLELHNGIVINVSGTSYCNVTYLFDKNGICGLDIIPDYVCNGDIEK